MKHALLKILGVVVITMLFSSCANEASKTGTGASFSLDSAKAHIAASNKVFGESFSTGDSAAFANLYTSDGCMYPPNMPKVCGPAAISAFFNVAFKGGIKNIALTTEEVMGGNDAVVEIGKYEVFIANNVSVEKGKFIVCWKEENGKWKMHRDMWNSDTAPVPDPADMAPRPIEEK